MRGCTLKMLNMSEYTGIYLKKQSAEYVRILNVADAVHNIRVLYKLLWAVVETETYSEHRQTFNNVWVLVRNEKFFRGGRGFGELVWKCFSQTPLKLHFEWEI